MAGRPSKGERVAFPLRIDPKVMEAVKGSAERELRSVNAQVEVLLREALRRRGHRLDEAPDGERESGT